MPMHVRFATVLVLAMFAVGCGENQRNSGTAPSQVPGSTAGVAGGGGMPDGGGMPGGMGGPGNSGGMFGGGGMGGGMNGGGGMGGGMSMMVASEFDYLTEMIPHHEEAIRAARLLEQGTRRAEMRSFAATIIRTQSAEVVQMKAWLAAWYPGRDTSVNYVPMMRDLTGLTGDALDRAFLEDMIPHHHMAVMMSQQLLMHDLATHADVVPFATAIRDTQSAEIQMMQRWLRDWFRSR